MRPKRFHEEESDLEVGYTAGVVAAVVIRNPHRHSEAGSSKV